MAQHYCTLVMLRYIESIDISFRYHYIESYRIGRLNIDFLIYRHTQFLFLRVDFYIPR